MQAKKVRRVQSAFEMFNRMMQTPGKAELTLTELRVSISTCPACHLSVLSQHIQSDVPAVLQKWRSGLTQVPVDVVYCAMTCRCARMLWFHKFLCESSKHVSDCNGLLH